LRVLRKSDIVLDAGANIGCFSILASKIASKIIAVEPNPDTFRHLLVNLRMNCVSNVVPVNVALLDKEGTALLEKHGLKSRISNSGARVRTTTIDKLTHGNVSIIKMDIEGSEIDALAGSEETFRNARAILLETHGTDEAVVVEIAKFGFKSEVINVGLMQKVRNAATLDFMYSEFQTWLQESCQGSEDITQGYALIILTGSCTQQSDSNHVPAIHLVELRQTS
jgi:FkbM family methyltransferase